MAANEPRVPQPQIASGISVRDYREWLEARDATKIACLVHQRIHERYIKPIKVLDELSTGRGTGSQRLTTKDGPMIKGFTMMAVACLTIETLGSFRHGWPETKSPHAALFRDFFAHHATFAPFKTHWKDFYKGVRCGILHQGETALGWRVRRDRGSILAEGSGVRTINASLFVRGVEAALDSYREELAAADWDDELWINLKYKMAHVCQNCEARAYTNPVSKKQQKQRPLKRRPPPC